MVEDPVGVVEGKVVGAATLEHVAVAVAKLENLVTRVVVRRDNLRIVAADAFPLNPSNVVVDGIAADFVAFGDGSGDNGGLHAEKNGGEDGCNLHDVDWNCCFQLIEG